MDKEDVEKKIRDEINKIADAMRDDISVDEGISIFSSMICRVFIKARLKKADFLNMVQGMRDTINSNREEGSEEI